MKTVNVHLILDQSGSMYTVLDDTIGGVNAYLASLRQDASTACNVSITTFSDQNQVVRALTPIASLEPFGRHNYHPMGSTALLDAIGTFFRRVELIDDGETPHLVVIVTDGEENASRYYTASAIRAETSKLEAKGNFTFVYIGANQDAFKVTQDLGIQTRGKTFLYEATGPGTQTMWNAAAAGTATLRSSTARGVYQNTAAFFVDPAAAAPVGLGPNTVQVDTPTISGPPAPVDSSCTVSNCPCTGGDTGSPAGT